MNNASSQSNPQLTLADCFAKASWLALGMALVSLSIDVYVMLGLPHHLSWRNTRRQVVRSHALGGGNPAGDLGSMAGSIRFFSAASLPPSTLKVTGKGRSVATELVLTLMSVEGRVQLVTASSKYHDCSTRSWGSFSCVTVQPLRGLHWPTQNEQIDPNA